MNYPLEVIKQKLGGRLVGRETMKRSVCLAIQKLPDTLIEKVTSSCWFVSSFEDAWGFVLTGEELQGKHLIFLNDELFQEGRDQIEYTILHEIGHVILEHRNAILQTQSEDETEDQEIEADKFARKYLV